MVQAWTAAHQTPPSMGFSRQEYWSGVPLHLTEAEDILRRGGKNTQKNCTKKDLHDPDNHDGVITHLEPDILEHEVKWVLGSIAMNRASEGDELFQLSYFRS